MLATSTHDTKRSEDVRARINVLSEMPERVARGRRAAGAGCNAASKPPVDGEPAPDRNDEYLLYQTLVGAWPLDATARTSVPASFTDRIAAYMDKATREAKVHTSWINPNAEYDAAVRSSSLACWTAGARDPSSTTSCALPAPRRLLRPVQLAWPRPCSS